MKKQLVLLVLAFGLAALLVFSLSFLSIYSHVKKACLQAKSEYHLDCVDSLIEVVNSEDYPFRQRNSAIWAIGQIADKKALPFLQDLEKTLPETESCGYNLRLCRHEVAKAIKWCSFGNVTSWMYAHRENW